MKIHIKISFIIAMTAMITASSCKKLLQENPKQGEYPSYLGTQAGIFAAITGVYSGLRNYYTNEGNVIGWYSGTDEQRYGQSATTMSYATYNPMNSGTTNGQFNVLYQYINTLNGAIQFAGSVNFDATTKAQYLAQAKFLRGFIYMYLVQTWGGVTATNPSGPALHLEFITQASSADQPAKLSDLWAAIIQDFTDAAANLPNKRDTSPFAATGGTGLSATAGTAQAYLAKAYLTRGYSAAAVTGDFQKAADLTASLITNQGTYGFGLWQDFSQVSAQANDYGKENIFGFDVGADPTYSGWVNSPSNGKGFNQQAVFFRWNYISISGVNSNASVPQVLSGANCMLRDVWNGRPYIRSWPNVPYTILTAFADQIHDSRYDNTFQTFWICNTATPAGLQTDGVTKKPVLVVTTPVSLTTSIPPTNGDTAILMPSTEVTVARRDAFKGQMTTPLQYSYVCYPAVKKFDDQVNRTTIFDFSTRPAVQMRFSEVYLMNAEANYMVGGATGIANAVASLNVLRQRAAYRVPADATYLPKSAASVTAANQNTVNAANAAAMALTPAQIAQLNIPNNVTVGSAPCGMDLILDEYTREFYGDLRRWYDLTRTQQLVRRVKMYNPEAAANIQPYNVLRPIPQDEINNVLTGPKYPQNQGY